MQYRLRTLLILMGIVPAAIAGAWCRPWLTAAISAFVIYAAVTLFVLGIIKWPTPP